MKAAFALLMLFAATAYGAPCTSWLVRGDGSMMGLPVGCGTASGPEKFGGRVLIARVNWSNGNLSSTATDEAVRAAAEGGAALWREYSRGAADLGPIDVPPRVTIQMSKPSSGCSIHNLRNLALNELSAKHGIDRNAYSYIVFLHPKPQGCPASGQTFGALGTHLYGGSSYYIARVPYAHEWGHNLGFGHAHTGTCGRSSCRRSTNEYSDPVQIMAGTGNSPQKTGWPATPLLIAHGWYPGTVLEGLGTHQLADLEGDAPRAVKITSGTDGRTLWVELRKDQAGPSVVAVDARSGCVTCMVRLSLTPGTSYSDGRVRITAISRDQVRVEGA